MTGRKTEQATFGLNSYPSSSIFNPIARSPGFDVNQPSPYQAMVPWVSYSNPSYPYSASNMFAPPAICSTNQSYQEISPYASCDRPAYRYNTPTTRASTTLHSSKQPNDGNLSGLRAPLAPTTSNLSMRSNAYSRSHPNNDSFESGRPVKVEEQDQEKTVHPFEAGPRAGHEKQADEAEGQAGEEMKECQVCLHLYTRSQSPCNLHIDVANMGNLVSQQPLRGQNSLLLDRLI